MTDTPSKTVEMLERLPYGSSTKDRLEAYSIPEPNSGCWLWLGSVRGRGYGQMQVNGRNCCAHRLSYEEFVGPIPEGLDVLHRCDTPSCINPGHLFAGTKQDNSDDMKRKGRGRLGQNHHNALLTDQQVTEIVYDLRQCKTSQRLIALKQGISAEAVSKINVGAIWAHFTGASTANPIRRPIWRW